MTPESAAVAIALGRAVIGLLAVTVVAATARDAVRRWIRHRDDQAALERAAKADFLNPLGARLGVAQQVPRETSNGHLRGNRERLAALARPGDVVVPEDLEAHCAQWEDSWARDDERAVIRAKFTELYTGDASATWQLVRRAVGVGEMP